MAARALAARETSTVCSMTLVPKARICACRAAKSGSMEPSARRAEGHHDVTASPPSRQIGGDSHGHPRHARPSGPWPRPGEVAWPQAVVATLATWRDHAIATASEQAANLGRPVTLWITSSTLHIDNVAGTPGCARRAKTTRPSHAHCTRPDATSARSTRTSPQKPSARGSTSATCGSTVTSSAPRSSTFARCGRSRGSRSSSRPSEPADET